MVGKPRCLFASLVCLSFVCVACNPCGSEIVREVPSPDGKWKAVLFQRSCGATTNFSTNVSILRSHEELPNDFGNAFVADDNDGAVPLSEKGVIGVALRWDSNRILTIAYPSGAQIFKQKMSHSFGRISIRYEEQGR